MSSRSTERKPRRQAKVVAPSPPTPMDMFFGLRPYFPPAECPTVPKVLDTAETTPLPVEQQPQHLHEDINNARSGNQPSVSYSPVDPSTLFDITLLRITAYNARYDLTEQTASLTALLHVLARDFSPSHALIALVADPSTLDAKITEIADTVNAGLIAFLARGGGVSEGFAPSPVPLSAATTPPTPPNTNTPAEPSTPDNRSAESSITDCPRPAKGGKSSKKSDSSRSQYVKSSCIARDNEVCSLTNAKREGIVSHIMPFSLRSRKGLDFGAFVALFRGDIETNQLRAAILGEAQTTDILQNVWWISRSSHHWFDLGKIAVVPDICWEGDYDPEKLSQYTATVEFPFGQGDIALAVWDYSGGRPAITGILSNGSKLIFTTPDSGNLPLPHPVMFQLHAMCSRVLAAKAAAGYPHPESYDDFDELDVEVDEEGEEYGTADVDGWLDERSETVSISSGEQPPRVWPMNPQPPRDASSSPPLESYSESDQRGKTAGTSTLPPEEKPRGHEAADMMLRGTMDERWGKMVRRLGREPTAGTWWRK